MSPLTVIIRWLMDLAFDVEVTEVREATKEELSHGHAHGPGGHHH